MYLFIFLTKHLYASLCSAFVVIKFMSRLRVDRILRIVVKEVKLCVPNDLQLVLFLKRSILLLPFVILLEHKIEMEPI